MHDDYILFLSLKEISYFNKKCVSIYIVIYRKYAQKENSSSLKSISEILSVKYINTFLLTKCFIYKYAFIYCSFVLLRY